MQISQGASDYIRELGETYQNPAIYFMEYDKETCCGIAQRIDPTVMEAGIGISRKTLVRKTLPNFPYPIFIEETHETIWAHGKVDVMGIRAAKKLVLLFPEESS